MNEVYALVAGQAGCIWIIPVPGGVEEDAFGELVKKETGLTVRGITYPATLADLKREQKRMRRLKRVS